jgi:hypothetical protein
MWGGWGVVVFGFLKPWEGDRWGVGGEERPRAFRLPYGCGGCGYVG